MVDPSALAKLIGEKYRSTARKNISEEQDRKFLSTLRGVSNTVFVYEDNDLLDYALEVLPLEELYSKAEKREAEDSTWGLQDYLVMELLRWFKQDFFKWVNHPKCSECGGDTKGIGSTAPNDYEKSGGAGIVELSECPNCKKTERFPRYNQPKRLLQTRQGRCGEWANKKRQKASFCFAEGSRVRYIWNSEDHVWTEVYSSRQRRWVHADSCEEAWDKPTLYSDGWGKKMAYVVAFSVEGAVDVTRRYVRDHNKALPRDKINETSLTNGLKSITNQLRESLPPDQRDQLINEDAEEEKELQSYQGDTPTADGLGPRESGSADWKKARGEDGAA